MSEVLLSVFRKEIMPHVPEAPEIVIDNAVLNACIEFCDDTHWVVHEQDPIDLVADQAAYDFVLPDDNEIARVISVHNGSNRLQPYSELGLSEISSWRTLTGEPLGYYQDDIHELKLVPIPTEATTETLKVVLALRPTRTATVVNSDLYDLWAEAIAHGARARLHELPRQPFSDLVLAAKCRSEFDRAKGRAKVQRNRGLATGPLYVRPPRFI